MKGPSDDRSESRQNVPVDDAEFRSRLKRTRRRLLAQLRHQWEWGFEDAETGGIGELSLYDQHPSDLGAELNARQVDLGLQQNMERMLEQVEKALKRIETGGYGTCERCGRGIDTERLQALPYVTLCITCQTEVDEPAGSSPRRSDGLNPAHVGHDDGFRNKHANAAELRARKHGMKEEAAGDAPAQVDIDLATGINNGTQASDEYARQRPGDSQRPIEELSLEPPFGRTFRDGDDYAAYDGEDAWQDVARFGTANTPQDVPPAVEYGEVYVDADEDRGIVSEVDALQDLGGLGVSVADIYPDPEAAKRGKRRRQ